MRLVSIIMLFSLSFYLTACFKPVATTTYFDEVNEKYIDVSQPIEADIAPEYNGPKAKINLILEHDRSNERYFVKLRWTSYSKYRPAIKIEDSLKFLVNSKNIFSLSAIKKPQIIKFEVTPAAIEEEAIYEIDRHLLGILARAEHIKLFTTGSRMAIKSTLDSQIQLMHFIDFMNITKRPD